MNFNTEASTTDRLLTATINHQSTIMWLFGFYWNWAAAQVYFIKR